MTINTSLYDTKNVLNFLEKDSTSGPRVKIAKKKIAFSKNKDGGSLLWSERSAEIPH